jgi:hypothetical protein
MFQVSVAKPVFEMVTGTEVVLPCRTAAETLAGATPILGEAVRANAALLPVTAPELAFSFTALPAPVHVTYPAHWPPVIVMLAGLTVTAPVPPLAVRVTVPLNP